ADVLVGAVNPSGRLPITFPIAEGQLPLRYNHEPTGRGDDYVDQTGEPAFPFGFGLSYTRFEYSDLRIEPATIASSGSARVTFRVRNTGARAGDEVAQLYVRPVVSRVAQPVMALKAISRVHLAPGEERMLTLALDARALQIVDEHMHALVPAGTTTILVGASSRDIRLRGRLLVRQ
ncbi:MAG TPA: fibronectin type III-like domain-contianing protein, partial [Gemmatimonadaceae bacterium]|nr:fibronectin type III-like domain-contianing protein [Gemmatimonadaceae bacterium]